MGPFIPHMLKYSVCSLIDHCNHDDGQVCGGTNAVTFSVLVVFSPVSGGKGRKSVQDR